MEKNSVSQTRDKKSSKSGSIPACPDCGSTKVFQRGPLMVCPNCGTKPWEGKHAVD